MSFPAKGLFVKGRSLGLRVQGTGGGASSDSIVLLDDLWKGRLLWLEATTSWSAGPRKKHTGSEPRVLMHRICSSPPETNQSLRPSSDLKRGSMYHWAPIFVVKPQDQHLGVFPLFPTIPIYCFVYGCVLRPRNPLSCDVTLNRSPPI